MTHQNQWPDANFLLPSETAKQLYHDVAADLPIIDFHNHLDPQAVLDDRHWADLGQAWLEHDHYKWRVMRWHGIEETEITGTAGSRTKFDAFAHTLPHCIGNPIYHWSHLELARYFGLDRTTLSPATADEIWNVSKEKLAQPEFGARGLLSRMNVRLIATTDDPCDDLAAHNAYAKNGAKSSRFSMIPTFRPDPAFKIGLDGFGAYVARLGDITGQAIRTFDDLIGVLAMRIDHFVAQGCRAADHGIERLGIEAVPGKASLDALLKRRLAGGVVDAEEISGFQNAVLIALGREYEKRGLVMQLHLGALRNNSTRLWGQLGPDAGGDSMDDVPLAAPLNLLLNRIQSNGMLPRMILYALDPTRNEVIVTTAGNFQQGPVAGHVQAGAAWWFNDQLDGMERQLTQLAQMGILWHFVGMLTDSRSFLSFPRHEYFRRLLCRMVGNWVDGGEIPNDPSLTHGLIRAVCYENAQKWFLPEV